MKSFLRWVFVVLSLVGGLALIGYMLVVYGVIRMNYPSRIIYPIQGIDVSHHQGDINWEAVEDGGWDFVIMKATEGGDWKDTKFLTYYPRATEAGLTVGVYHYYSFCSDPMEQAYHYISVAGDLHGNLRPVVDVEFDKNCNGAVPVADFQEGFKLFVKKIVDHYQVYPIVYCNEQFYNKYLNHEAFKDCVFWVRNIVRQPDLNGVGWSFWQYTASGRIKGIDGPVDLNAFNGDQVAFDQLLIE